ncbi:MAG: DNA polymerase III subunit gamma/tau, partial [Bacteroidales bacterium]|nr:DNA polymerase III subunit gamma/tau [Bacteroidales bacterium]
TDQVRIPPQIGRYSVYIIDEVHMLSQAAFNAFLKTLEEPPEYAIFILATTEKHKILPTILSRCQTYDFSRIRVEDIVRNLKDIAAQENVTVSDDALHIIAQKADGAMRDSLTLFDQTVAFCGGDITYEKVIGILNVLDYDYYFRLTDMLLAGDFAQALLLFDEILSKGFDALHFISGMSSHLRDLIVCRNASSRSLMEMAPTIAARYDEYSKRCSMEFLYKALEISTAAETAYKTSGNPRLLIEFALIKMSRILTAAPQPAAAQPVAPARPVAAQPAPAKPAPAPAAAAPAPAPASAAAPAVPKSEVKTGKTSGISIKELMSKATAQAAAPQTTGGASAAEIDPKDITEEMFAAGWEKFIAGITRPNLKAALSANTPKYSAEEGTATQFVASVMQRDWIVDHQLLKLQGSLQSALGSRVLLKIEVQPQDEEPKVQGPYMPTEVAQKMKEDSANVSDFTREFELEVK